MMIVWTDYMKHRVRLRGFDLAKIERIVRHSGSAMNKTRMMYFEKDDVLHLVISDEPERGSVELGPDITVELNGNGELIGIEILNASTFLRDSILESVQARMLRLPELQAA
jgi:uncharacterized protein YuzE